ncbi:MAG: lysozyme, partial [Alphaproteobacteria bacterium]|nr:lysozyme [Alphaproteobacteria bacterium]
GLNPPCFTTAAGGYQFIRPTWQRLRDRLGLEDFSPASQDAAAVELLREVGALDLIEQGDIEGAMKKASKAWASLPGSLAQQNPRAPQFAFARFAEGQRLFA